MGVDAEQTISHDWWMGGRDRHQAAESPTLGARQLMRVLEELAASERLVDYRVAYKKNAKDEHVVALIYRSHPAL